MKMKPGLALALFVALCLAAGGVGGWATATSVRTWYPTLEKPAWTPPDALFGPVWTALYVMMGFAAWRVWRTGPSPGRQAAILAFGLQLALNTGWSLIFFGLREVGWAFAEIVVLWLAIVATIVLFARVCRVAAWLLVPYLLWVSFASALNLSIWLLNR